MDVGPSSQPAVPGNGQAAETVPFNQGILADHWVDDVAANWPKLDGRTRGEIRRRVRRLEGITAGGTYAERLQRGWVFPAGFLLAGAWLTVFSFGFAVSAAPYIGALDTGAVTDRAFVGSLVMVVLCSTPTNPGLLACIAALLGGLGNWVHIDGSAPKETDAAASLQRVCFAPMLRGFFMYLALLAGLLLLTTEAITKPTKDQYVQLAGTVSVFAFMLGYDPDVFKRLMGKVSGWAAQREDAGPANVPRGAPGADGAHSPRADVGQPDSSTAPKNPR